MPLTFSIIGAMLKFARCIPICAIRGKPSPEPLQRGSDGCFSPLSVVKQLPVISNGDSISIQDASSFILALQQATELTDSILGMLGELPNILGSRPCNPFLRGFLLLYVRRDLEGGRITSRTDVAIIHMVHGYLSHPTIDGNLQGLPTGSYMVGYNRIQTVVIRLSELIHRLREQCRIHKNGNLLSLLNTVERQLINPSETMNYIITVILRTIAGVYRDRTNSLCKFRQALMQRPNHSKVTDAFSCVRFVRKVSKFAEPNSIKASILMWIELVKILMPYV